MPGSSRATSTPSGVRSEIVKPGPTTPSRRVTWAVVSPGSRNAAATPSARSPRSRMHSTLRRVAENRIATGARSRVRLAPWRLGRNAKVDIIRNAPLFAQLSRAEVNEVAKIADEIDVKAGKVLTREGDRGNEFFVLLDGAAEVHQGGKKVRMLGPGDFFGEIALVSRSPRTATVTTTTPVRPPRDHGHELPGAARPLASDPAARARGARRPARAERGLGAQLGAEALGESLDDPCAEGSRILVGERPLGRLEREPQRDRLAALADLLAAVDVEDVRPRAAPAPPPRARPRSSRRPRPTRRRRRRDPASPAGR